MTDKTDSVATYLLEISRTKLLTANEEIELARRIQDLLQLEAVCEGLKTRLNRKPSSDEWAKELDLSEAELSRRLTIGRKAKNRIISANLRLVVSIAKSYTGRGLSFQDLIQEGSLGLIKAAEKFNPELGYKFSTYAHYWIKQAISRGIDNASRTIRLPANLSQKAHAIAKKIADLYSRLGQPPTEEQIAAAMEITVDKLRFILESTQKLTSIDRLIDNDQDTTIGDLIPASDKLIEERILEDFLHQDLQFAIDALEDDEAKVLSLRYGINDRIFKTVAEVAQILNLTPKMVEKIERKALRKLRHPGRSQLLRAYLN